MLDQPSHNLLHSIGLFLPAYYRREAALPDDLSADDVFDHFLATGLRGGFSPSPLFDDATALRAAAEAGLPGPRPGESALAYWLRQGIVAQVVPTALFDADYYRRTYPDVAEAGYFGFLHFLLFGLAEGRRPNLWFEPFWYGHALPGREPGLPAMVRFLIEGAATGASPSRALRLFTWPVGDRAAMIDACIAVDASLRALACMLDDVRVERLAGLFLPDYYKRQASLPAATGDVEAFGHFVATGLARGLSCSPLFDGAWYLRQARAAGLPEPAADEPALVHWLRYGLDAWVVPTPCFDPDFYLGCYPEVAAAGGFSFLHFLDHGLYEGRQPVAWFDAAYVQARLTAGGCPGFLAFLLHREGGRLAPCGLIGEVLARLPGDAADPAAFQAAFPALQTHFEPLRRALAPWAMDLLFALVEPLHYIRQAALPPGTTALEAFAHLLDRGLRAEIDPTPLFDTGLYRRIIEATADALPIGGEPPLLHYVHYGVLRRIVPTVRFDEEFYLATYPDLDPVHVFGYEHFLRHGMAERRQPHAWFEETACAGRIKGGAGLATYLRLLLHGLPEGVVPASRLVALIGSDVVAGGIAPERFDALLVASRAWAGRLGRHGFEIALALFIPEAYDGAGALAPETDTLDRLIHFLQAGLSEGHPIGPLFDAAHYAAAAKDAGLPAIAGVSAILHFLVHGLPAQVVPSRFFDLDAYLAYNADLAGLAIWPFEHFIRHGVYEGRAFSRLPMASIAVPSGVAARPAARMRLLISCGEIPAATPAADRGRIGVLLDSQERLRAIMQSAAFAGQMAQVLRLDPGVGAVEDFSEFMVPPFFDPMAEPHRALRARLPRLQYDTVVCIPWIRTGGSDLLSGLFVQALLRIRPAERVLLLRVDHPHYERPDWIPGGIDVVDISDILERAGDKLAEQLLYTLFLGVAPARVVNVNSRLAWCCLRRFGERLAGQMRLYGYMFCWDQTKSGRKVGYPTDFYPVTAPFMAGVLTDSDYLKNELVRMYALPPALADRLMPLNTPTRVQPAAPTMAERGAATAGGRKRPLVLWGGRLDHQKRFDILLDVARLLPQIDFHCWGAAVLDPPPDLSALPANVAMHGPFRAPTDLPLGACDGWLFTSAWEGMPNMVIELATLGVPMVCSAVGGVPDLIDATTGWPIDPASEPYVYALAVTEMVTLPALRVAKARAAQARAVAMFAQDGYDRALSAYLDRVPEPLAP